MQRRLGLNLFLMIVATAGLGMNLPTAMANADLPVATDQSGDRMAQLFYPRADDPSVIAVTGQGSASAAADTAQLEFTFSNYDPVTGYPGPLPEDPSIAPPVVETTLTESSIQPIVNALVDQGIPRSDIEVNVNSYGAFSPFSSTNASITVNLDAPTQTRMSQIVATVDSTLESSDPQTVFLQSIYAQYAVNQCETLEQAAYQSAIEDAQMRADAIAQAMGVEISQEPSVAELPFFGRLYSPCQDEADVLRSAFGRSPTPYDPAAQPEVEVYREVAVTYQIRS